MIGAPPDPALLVATEPVGVGSEEYSCVGLQGCGDSGQHDRQRGGGEVEQHRVGENRVELPGAQIQIVDAAADDLNLVGQLAGGDSLSRETGEGV